MSYLPLTDPGHGRTATSVAARQMPSGKVDRLVVKKAERRLYLMQGDQALRTYAIALGFQPIGHKTREGDGRTPEGRYLLDRRNHQSRFHKALHISYPNAQDAWRARHRGESPGGMILIHGQPAGRSSTQPGAQLKNRAQPTAIDGDWTLGCIAVSNREIEEIWALTVDGTPIEILP